MKYLMGFFALVGVFAFGAFLGVAKNCYLKQKECEIRNNRGEVIYTNYTGETK